VISKKQDRKKVEDPITLALRGTKFAKMTFDEIERINSEEQAKYEGDY